MIPHSVLEAITRAELPCFVYDGSAAGQRAVLASSLLDRYFFPVKACPEPGMVRTALAAGSGLDLCSEGDADIASSAGCPGDRCKFSSASASDRLLRRLCEVGAVLDADSAEQALRWGACGGTVCGLRIRATSPNTLYGAKFGVPARDAAVAATGLAAAGLRVEGLHLHDQHANLAPAEFATRIAATVAEVDPHLLGDCRYFNLGGSWPMRHGNPASVEELRAALCLFRERLAALGFRGALHGEPGRWVVGPCGYWAARVAALKAHPSGDERRVVVLDTNTPLPCRPSLAPFVVLRDGILLKSPRSVRCDLFGSANTALDRIGADVRLPVPAVGDVVVSLGQGAYTRSLIPPFNERERPSAIVLGCAQAQGSPSPAVQASAPSREHRNPSIYVFNPFAEGFIARGKAFTPVKHQVLLANDLANLPQFLCRVDDIVLVPERPSSGFLESLVQAGFASPEFVELRSGRIVPDGGLIQRQFGSLRPWAWGPDSVRLLEPLFGRTADAAAGRSPCFAEDIARLYSKTWSAALLKQLLAHYHSQHALVRAEAHPGNWLCSEQEAGVAAGSLEDAFEAIAAIRRRGHHRVVVKQAYGLAGHNALRLWEPEVLPAQRQWLAHALKHSRQLVVEPWLERELDFSVHFEVAEPGLSLCGCTGLVNDRKGQFLANWAEPDYHRHAPAEVARCFPSITGISEHLQRLYGVISSWLEPELRRAGFMGPVSIDAFVYRTSAGSLQLKPVVEVNPRYTMGRLTLELMKHTAPERTGLFRLITPAQARAQGFVDFPSYAAWLGEQFPLRMEDGKIREGAIPLNDPGRAQVCLATFEVCATLSSAGLFPGRERRWS